MQPLSNSILMWILVTFSSLVVMLFTVKIFKIILLFLFIFGVKAIVNPYGPTVVNEFTDCITKLMENNFKEPGLLIFANANNRTTQVLRITSELLKVINEKIKYSINVLNAMNEVPICRNHDENLGVLHVDQFEAIRIANYFLFVIDNYKEFPCLASKVIRSRSWNPHAKFIILLFQVSNKIKTFVEEIFNCLFKYNVTRVVVVAPQSDNIRNAFIYGWRPFDPPKYCGYHNETANDRVLIENICERGSLKYQIDVFRNRLPEDMKDCVVHILALKRQPFVSENQDDPNMEKVLINQILGKFNLKTYYEIIPGYRGEREAVGQWNGALKELVSKKGQLLLGGIYPDFDVHEDFECSSSYLADSYTWVVPRAYQSPPWVALIIIFQDMVWYSAMAGFFVCVISWRILGQISGDSLYNKSLDHCFFNVWISAFGFCAYTRPVKKSLRVFFVFFNLYCILFLTAYQTKLIDVLKNPTFEYQIKTVEELATSGLKFGGFEELHDLFLNSSDPFDSYLGSQWIDVDNMSKALIDVAVYRNFSVLCSRLELAHIAAVTSELSDSYGNYRYYAFDRNMFTVPMEMVAMKGFAFMSVFSKALEVYRQNGINMFVRRQFATFSTSRRAKLLRSLLTEKYEINALSVQHLQGGFLALLLGYISGTLVLIIEIFLNSKFVRKKLFKVRQWFGKNQMPCN